MAFNSSYTAICSAITLQSNKDGFFQQFADRITNLVDSEWLNNFVELSNEKKILKCLTDKKVRNDIFNTLDNIQEVFRGKSARLSQQRCQEAEHLSRNGKLEKAVLMYTQSVIRAPVAGANEGVSLALVLWRRSDVLFELKKYQLCLDDVKLALQEKLPDEYKLDAYWRMVECYVNLDLIEQARISLKIMLKLIPAENSSLEEKIRQKLQELDITKLGNNAETNPTSIAIGQEQILAVGKHQQFENASLKLQLAKSVVAGKYFVAQEPINTGDTLLIEEPYVSCLSPEKYSSHCHNCLQRLETGIPCTNCSAVAFCSLKCRVTALKSYHKYECRYLDILIGSGMSVLSFAALRIVTQQNLKYFVDALTDQKIQHVYNQVQSLVTHDDKRTGVDFLHRTLMALFLLAVLKKSKYFLLPTKMDSANPQEILIGKVLLRNLEILQFNAHEIFEPVRFKNTNKPLKALPIGIGLYRTASYFNHDCYPAISRFFVGTKLHIKAIRPLGRNETVGDNYGPVFTKHDFNERQQKLISRYWFKCECCACLQNWPKVGALNDKVFKLKCKTCDRLIIYEEGSEDVFCKNCFQSCAPMFDEVLRLIDNVEAMKSDDAVSNDDKMKKLYNLQDSLANSLYPPHRIFNEIQEQLTQYWIQQGKIFEVSL